MKALMKGVHELIPSNLLSIFDPNELELLVCGLQKIDVKDWKDNTLYKGGYAPNHPLKVEDAAKAELLTVQPTQRTRFSR
ncbi:E3 ubiquitin-protein ligase NEDD4-like [Toxocara canis]|uniref:HECT-type E3 ubiquitin transferase n=1 Tax=Toxocara canis TaxID=6265 RepID=A0A0B2UQG8_TOXCA|nr:E3 ubiquitin-protein ligase NEDD4-like [Toxocara canis]